jgi:hypothetical protein
MDTVTLELRKLVIRRYEELDEENRPYTYYDVEDYDKIGEIELLTDDDGNFDSKDILDMLHLLGHINSSYIYYIEPDKYDLAFRVFNGVHKPLYELVIV